MVVFLHTWKDSTCFIGDFKEEAEKTETNKAVIY